LTRKWEGTTLKLVGQVDKLVVNSQLLPVVGNDQDSDGARALAESLPQLIPEVALVNNLQPLLDLTRLGHGNQLSIITDINESVLFEDRPQEGVEDNRWRWVRDNTWLLVELLGEEVNTEVPVLTSLSGGGDANNLAWAVLENHQVTNADVVARDGECGGLGGVDGGDMGGRLDLRVGFHSMRGRVCGVSIGVLLVVFVLGHCIGGWVRRRSVKKFFVVREEFF
jgi:hypothetical protein